jgi:hypothetical protein
MLIPAAAIPDPKWYETVSDRQSGAKRIRLPRPTAPAVNRET